MATNLDTTAWKVGDTEDGIEYGLQIDGITYKFRKPVQDAMKDWTRTSYVWNTKNRTEIFIYRKTFKSEQDWISWAQKFPLTVKEKRIWGEKVKLIIHKKAG